MAESRFAVLYEYCIGAGAFLFLVSLLGCTCYNGIWLDDNKWRNYQYGNQHLVYQLSASALVFSLVGVIVVFSAFLAQIYGHGSKPAGVGLWVASYIFVIVCIILEGLGLEYTKYGDAYVPSLYNYYEDDDFREYVDTYDQSASNADWSPRTVAVPSCVNTRRAEVELNPVPDDTVLDMSQYMQPYVQWVYADVYEHRTIAPCVFNWTSLALSTKMMGLDPCLYSIGDNDALKCIGSWTGEKFQLFWCAAYRLQVVDIKRWRDDGDKTDIDLQKRTATDQVSYWSLDSLSAFYRHTTLLMYMQIAAFVLTTLGLVGHRKVAPPPKEKKKETESEEEKKVAA
jgi:hypothetical protein